MEYTIRTSKGYVILTQTKITYTKDVYFATLFRSKEKAEKIGKKVDGIVEVFYGAAIPQGSKQHVQPKQSPINRSSAYRSI